MKDFSTAVPAASLMDLIHEALGVMDAQQARVMQHLVDDVGDRLRDAQKNPHQRAIVLTLRRLAGKLATVSRAYDFYAGLDLVDGVDALTSRLLVGARVAPEEWQRVSEQQQQARRALR